MDKDPPEALSVVDYIDKRLDDQRNYYSARLLVYQKRAEFWRGLSLSGSVLSAILAAVSALISLSSWVALLATIITSITAYVRNQHYESLVAIYQSTALGLQSLKDQWQDSGKSDADTSERNAFVGGCEQLLREENGAWVVQWSQAPVVWPSGTSDTQRAADTSPEPPST